jgi:nitrogen fixation/metabolism regulation signal transduction histidine kinase
MVGLVVLSLIGFSVASSSFVTQQYKEYTSDLVLEKARSLSKQLSTNTSNKLFHYGTIDARNYQLQLWSDIYMTDLNYYDVNGGLQGSSRPVIFSKGLLSKNIHPAAFFALKTNKSVAHIQTETIGNLTYLSAYIPLYDHNKSVFGYLNVQHFDQQTLFENQIQQFFIAIINVFMLLLVVSIVGAIAISSWITAPLRMIQKHFNRVAFGKSNQPITYEADDEIGDLLAAYNRKLADLEAAAVLLAQSEREGAWREMAKQVAHEIKNPLTPMKLRIQQLERVFDPTDPDAKQKIQQVTRSIVEQIDSLADIANAFSSFAQFPDPKLQPVSLFELVQGVAQIFESEHAVDFNLSTPSSSIIIDGDSTQLIRVFNNLFANSIQAVDFGKKAIISIDFEQQVGTIIIRIKDNGNGIPDEQLDTIFEPYFTTKSTGTGLGLALVKQLISGHQGTITVETTSENGTTFMLVFPTNQA